MLINFSIIINLDNEYPRNLVSCPLDKTILVERNKKNNFINTLYEKTFITLVLIRKK